MCFRKLSEEALCACTAFAVMGCSVLEDRQLCPCVLTLSFEKVSVDDFEAVDVVVASADNFLYNNVVACSDYSQDLTINVPKGDVTVSAVSFFNGSSSDISSGVKIPYGSQCPTVYMYSAFLDTRCEDLSDTIFLHKNFCMVTIEIQSLSLADGTAQMELEGSVDGYELDGHISDGPFLARENVSGRCVFMIPRQKDSSLRMKIRQGDAVLRIFPLGDYIIQSGYDWNQVDLEDISVILNYANMSLVVTENGSSESHYFELEV